MVMIKIVKQIELIVLEHSSIAQNIDKDDKDDDKISDDEDKKEEDEDKKDAD